MPSAVCTALRIRCEGCSSTRYPTRPSGSAPATLKYRRIMLRNPYASVASRSMTSVISFDHPYGLLGRSCADSDTGTTLGSPYTAAEEEKTKCLTPPATDASSTSRETPELLR